MFLFTRAEVQSAELVSASMREIVLAAPEFASWRCEPGCSVRLGLGRIGVDVQRTYSVWQHDPAASVLVLRAHLVPDGPGARWAARVAPGDNVFLRGPRGKFAVDPSAQWHLFAGDETGAVPLLAMRDSLPARAMTFVALEAAGPEHQVPAADVAWARSPGLPAAVRELSLPGRPGVAYVAGSRDLCVAVRRYLVQERGWPRRSVRVSVHWAPGKRGMELRQRGGSGGRCVRHADNVAPCLVCVKIVWAGGSWVDARTAGRAAGGGFLPRTGRAVRDDAARRPGRGRDQGGKPGR